MHLQVQTLKWEVAFLPVSLSVKRETPIDFIFSNNDIYFRFLIHEDLWYLSIIHWHGNNTVINTITSDLKLILYIVYTNCKCVRWQLTVGINLQSPA